MPCKRAMITKVISVDPDKTIGDVLAMFNEYNIRGVPVVENDEIVGVFHLRNILQNLLPVNVTVDHGVNLDLRLDYLVGAAPGIAKRLRKLLLVKVGEVMEPVKDLRLVTPETPLWEGVRLLVKYDSPLAVVESQENRKMAGIISSQSIVKALLDMAAEEEKNLNN